MDASRRRTSVLRLGTGFEGIGLHSAAAISSDDAVWRLAPQAGSPRALLRAGCRSDRVCVRNPRAFLPLRRRQFFPARTRVADLAEKLRTGAVVLGIALGRSAFLNPRRRVSPKIGARRHGVDRNRTDSLQLPDVFLADSQPAA